MTHPLDRMLRFGLPYRIDINSAPPDAVDVLVQLGALDIEWVDEGMAAILPDAVTQETVASALAGAIVAVSAAMARDNNSVWLLNPGAVRLGSLTIAPPEGEAVPNALRLTDSGAFGTGRHPTTALCVEALEEMLSVEQSESMLDVGTGSGILALAALMMGVPHAVGLDIDAEALKAAAENARLNHFEERLELVLGGPDAVSGQWPLVVANVLAAPLIEMAPILVRRVGRRGRLILSGIPAALAAEVSDAYQHFGMQPSRRETRGGWTMLMSDASW